MHFRIFLWLSTNAARFCPFTVVRRITPAGTCTSQEIFFTYGVFPRILRKGRASAMNVARKPCLHLAMYGVNVFVLSGVFICDMGCNGVLCNGVSNCFQFFVAVTKI